MGDPIPRIIWMLWLQGWDEAPDIVQACLKTWQAHHPTWTIQALSAADIHHYLDADALSFRLAGMDMPPEVLSDLIRIELLERYGGVWADGTVYCLQPLDFWLPELLASGFFAFAKPAPDRMLSTWFIAAPRGNYIVREWLRQAHDYWSYRSRRDHYFWFHYLFAQGYKSDPRFRKIWDSTPVLSADEPHYYAPYEKLSEEVSSEDIQFLDSPPTPVLKLTHKLPDVQYGSDTVLGILRAQAEGTWRRAFDHQNTFTRPRDLLVTWYGSFDGHGTIGDLMAMQSVVTQLVGSGHNVFHASAEEITIAGSHRVEWKSVSPKGFDALIFVCGPILRSHPETNVLFKEFEPIPKIGVSVSIFPEDHINHFDPFDEVLAREGKNEQYHDVAIVAPAGRVKQPIKPKHWPTIGIVLRGLQGEYGEDLCLWERTAQITDEAAKTLSEGLGARVIVIENHLHRSGMTKDDIEAQYSECHLIITSRFHGAMMALRHFIPFIAIDQIQGGAKVMNLIQATQWPYVYGASGIDSERLVSDASELLSHKFDEPLFKVRTDSIRQANVTLSRLIEVVSGLPHRKPTDTM